MKKISVVIPTLQRDVETLNNLVSTLLNDAMVDEILIIDNSLQNYSFNNEKVRVIVPQENLFVNPSWNLGVREARNEYVCLANDDIRIPNNFCTKVLENFSDDFGVVGMDNAYVTNTRNKDNKVVIDINKVELNDSREVNFKPVKYRTHNFGIMMFFKKENYVEIPEDLKIFYGDDWIIYHANKKGKQSQVCTGQEIYHLGSLSSCKFVNVVKKEDKIYWNYVLPKYKRIFNHVETCTHNIFYIFGIKISIKSNYKNKLFANTINYKNIPIYIISFNRLTMLKQLVNCLEEKGYTNVQIIDNQSTYPPLLEYYNSISNKVHYLDKNYGHMAFWNCGQFEDVIKNEYYVVTDSDILPVEDCPDDFIELFYEILNKNPHFTKVGFSLKIDDIPDTNKQKKFIVRWESEFYKLKYKYKFKNKDFNVYDADIDTTFALYKPNINTKKFGVAIRTGYPYQSIHQPWYRDSSIVTEEELYYQKHAKQNISNYSVNITNKELENRTKQKLNLLENIFSITNIGAYKQIHILGINVKFKRRKVNIHGKNVNKKLLKLNHPNVGIWG